MARTRLRGNGMTTSVSQSVGTQTSHAESEPSGTIAAVRRRPLMLLVRHTLPTPEPLRCDLRQQRREVAAVNNKNEIELKAQLTRDELVGHLHALADSIASGRVVIEHGLKVAQLE